MTLCRIAVIHVAPTGDFESRNQRIECIGQVEHLYRIYKLFHELRLVPHRQLAINGVSFSDEDLKVIDMLHQDTLVITLQVENFKVKRILVDRGAGASIIFLSSLLNMELTTKDLKKTQSILVGFDRSSAQAIRNIPCIVFTLSHNLPVNFVVIEALSVYNIITG